MLSDITSWRRLWRARGLAVDKLLPICFGVPSPAVEDLAKRTPRAVVLPDGGKKCFDGDDAACVLGAAAFAASYVAEFLPAQVVSNDKRSMSPGQASQLAVQRLGGGELDYVGSFDVLLRLHARSSSIWKPYDNTEMALDFKITGASSPFGLHGATMRTYIEHARRVILDARAQKLRVGSCQVIAFLIYRPPGLTYDGRAHRGAEGFLAYDAGVLCSWSPKAKKLPAYIVMSGSLIQSGKFEPLESTALPAAVSRRSRRDRWGELGQMTVRRGWVQVQDFAMVFQVPPVQTLKKATQKVLERLRKAGCSVEDHSDGSQRGRPSKIARIGDLSRAYPDLQ